MLHDFHQKFRYCEIIFDVIKKSHPERFKQTVSRYFWLLRSSRWQIIAQTQVFDWFHVGALQ